MATRKKLGEILVEQAATNLEAVQKALALQVQRKEKIGRLLVGTKAVSEDQLARALSAQSRMPLAKMKSEVPPALSALLPAELAERKSAVPFGSRTVDGADTVYIAIADPYDNAGMDEIRQAVGKPVKFALAASDEIARSLVRVATRAGEKAEALAAAPVPVAPPAAPLAATPAAPAYPVPASLFPATTAPAPAGQAAPMPAGLDEPPPTSAAELDALLGLTPAPPPRSPSAMLDDLLGAGPVPAPEPLPEPPAPRVAAPVAEPARRPESPVPTSMARQATPSPVPVTRFPSKIPAVSRSIMSEPDNEPISWADGFFAAGGMPSGEQVAPLPGLDLSTPSEAAAAQSFVPLGGLDLSPESSDQTVPLEIGADSAAALGTPIATLELSEAEILPGIELTPEEIAAETAPAGGGLEVLADPEPEAAILFGAEVPAAPAEASLFEPSGAILTPEEEEPLLPEAQLEPLQGELTSDTDQTEPSPEDLEAQFFGGEVLGAPTEPGPEPAPVLEEPQPVAAQSAWGEDTTEVEKAPAPVPDIPPLDLGAPEAMSLPPPAAAWPQPTPPQPPIEAPLAAAVAQVPAAPEAPRTSPLALGDFLEESAEAAPKALVIEASEPPSPPAQETLEVVGVEPAPADEIDASLSAMIDNALDAAIAPSPSPVLEPELLAPPLPPEPVADDKAETVNFDLGKAMAEEMAVEEPPAPSPALVLAPVTDKPPVADEPSATPPFAGGVDLSKLFSEPSPLPAPSPLFSAPKQERPGTVTGPVEVDSEDIIEIDASFETEPAPEPPPAPAPKLSPPRHSTPLGMVSEHHRSVASPRLKTGSPGQGLLDRPAAEPPVVERRGVPFFDADALDGFGTTLPSEAAKGPEPAAAASEPAPQAPTSEPSTPAQTGYIEALARLASGVPANPALPQLSAEKLGQTVVKLLLARGAITPGELVGLLSIPADKLSSALVKLLLERTLIRTEDVVAMLMMPPERVTATALKILLDRGAVTSEDLAKALA